MRIFVYEYACAQPTDAAVPESVRVEGRAMRDALVLDFARLPGCEVLTLDGVIPALVAGGIAAIRSAGPQGPGLPEQAMFAGLAALADRTIVIAPEFDGLLLERCRWVLEAGGRLLGPSPEIVELTGDKWAAYQLLTKNSVRTPRTWLAEMFRARSVSEGEQNPLLTLRTLRYVCKPRYGAGSLDLQLIDSEAAEEAPPGFLVQEYVSGFAASVAFLTGPTAITPLCPTYQHLSDDGRFQYRGGHLPLPPELRERAVRLARSAIRLLPRPLGYLGVDLVLGAAADGSEDHVIEINPRLTTSYIGLRALALDNLAEAMLRLASGERVPPVTWRPGEVRFTPDGLVG